MKTYCPGSFVHSKLEELRREGKYSDVCILVDEKVFKCHRILLAAASSYFDSMFCGNFKESHVEELRIHDINSESFEEVLQYMYCGKLTITEVNAFNLLRTSEFLSVRKIRDSCIKFILDNRYLMKNVIDIFVWARAVNILQLIDPLLDFIAHDLIGVLSESTAFLEMPFDDLCAVLIRRSKFELLPLEVDDLLVDALVRWLHYSFSERKNCFKSLGLKIPSTEPAEISAGYLKFLVKNYNLNRPVLEKLYYKENKSFYETYITCYDKFSPEGLDRDHNLLPNSFADYQSLTNPVSMNLIFKKKIFSINKYKPDGFISHARDFAIKPCEIYRSITSTGSDYLYCLKQDDNTDNYCSQSFCAYSSIDFSKSNLKNLCPPPVNSKLEGALDEKRNSIYFASSYIHHSDSQIRRNTLYSTNFTAFSVQEIEGGIFYYNCEIDKWFSIPQMIEKKVGTARPIINNNLVYFVSDDYRAPMRVYDTRSSQCLTLPARSLRYYPRLCCTLDGKIYLGHGESMEIFDPTAEKWELVKQISAVPIYASHMVSYENMLWLFQEDIFESEDEEEDPVDDDEDEYFKVHIYNPKTRKLDTQHHALSGQTIFAKCKTEQGWLDDVIVFNSH